VYFTQLNAGKRNICLDLRDPVAAALVARLAERVDVFIENFRPGVLEKRGLGHASYASATASSSTARSADGDKVVHGHNGGRMRH
jgi:crotonobetainyl-CoA:carnitine CoA-transferase CaiB-like acyl-CoA transferase